MKSPETFLGKTERYLVYGAALTTLALLYLFPKSPTVSANVEPQGHTEAVPTPTVTPTKTPPTDIEIFLPMIKKELPQNH